VGALLGIPGVPAIDLPIASAGSLVGVVLAAQLAERYGDVLVVGAEIMSRVVSFMASDGVFAGFLRLDFDAPLRMDGRSLILQAARKLPRTISQLLERNHLDAAAVGTFVMHQANLNLITRVAAGVGADEARFYRNIARYGNTSSASLLIAAAEWWRECGEALRAPLVLAAFGAGLHWGAALALPVDFC
jgi:3-oxoacyl-[acyl-carrier-protein] synthase-3